MQEQSIFIEALEREDPAERAAYLDQVCAGDPAQRRRIERLLERHRQPDSFLDSLGDALAATVEDPTRAGQVQECPGTVIGHYKLLEQIGEGGMGVVFMAEQQEPIRRKVALKVLKPGMDTRQVVARFEAERQALGLMDHPNIAHVFDGGATDSGRPFFVMELVQGVPITDYCDQSQRTPRERLELFVSVCQALQHAHQKGIIHRDLKPSNVLITLHDCVPVVKVIDFGIAKATGPRLTEKTLFTHFNQMIGTPLYMSPEQAGLSGLDVDTRSDIYSLGVLLYELLTGTTPLEREQFREANFEAIGRIIREQEPPRPSTRISTLGPAATTVAAQRKSDPKRLSQLFRGELDWIVMKALEKDRNRRYETASAFAADVQRYLHDEAVQACPPSAGYRLRKFMRRNKGPVVAAGLLFAALVAGIAGTTWGLLRADRATQEARDNEQMALAAAAAEKQARETAQKKEAETWAVLEFMQNQIFSAARPKGQAGGLGRDVPLRQAMEAALPFVDKSFTNQPLTEARLRVTMGNSFRYLGDAKIAAKQFERACALYTQHLGPDHPNTLVSRQALVISYQALGRHTDALKLTQETLALMKVRLGPDHPDTLRSMNSLAISYAQLGRSAEALPLFEEVLARRQATLGPDHSDTLGSMNNLARIYDVVGRHTDALKLHKETLALRQAKLGPDHPDTLMSMNNLALSEAAFGRHAEAMKIYSEALTLQKAKLGPNHPDTLMTMNNLANSYEDLGRYTDAVKLHEETLARMKDKLGAAHSYTLASMTNLANSYNAVGRYTDALKLREETLALKKAKLGPDHQDTLKAMNNLALSYGALGCHAEALKLHEETLARRGATLGPEHPDTLESMNNLAASLNALGRPTDAVKLFQETLALQKVKLGPDHPHRLRSMGNLAFSYTALDRHAEALTLHEETLARRRAKLGPDHPDTLKSMWSLANSYAAAGRYAEALKLHEETLALRKAKLGPDHPDTLRSMNSLAVAYQDAGQREKALPLFEQTLVKVKETLGPDHPDTLTCGRDLALAYLANKQAEKAVALLPLLRSSLATQEKRLGRDSPELAEQQRYIAGVLLGVGRPAEAGSLLRECLAVYEKKQPDAWRTFSARALLGASLLGQRQYADAEPLLVQGYEGMKQRAAQMPWRSRTILLAEALERLVKLSEATKNEHESARWRKELEALKRQP